MMFRKKKITAIDYKRMYQDTFGTETGALVLNDLCNKFHVMSATRKIDDGPGDMEFREGQRNVMLFILKQVDLDLAAFRNQREQNQVEISG